MDLQPPCGCQLASISPSSLTDASALLERSKQLDDLISRRVQERAEVLQRVNELCARTRNLPHDILSEIFRFACVSPGSFDFPLSHTQNVQPYSDQALSRTTNAIILSAVSALWRRVAWCTPYIWSTLRLCVRVWNLAWCVDTLQQFLLNSGGLPLTLRLDFSKWQDIDGIRCADPEISSPLRIKAIEDVVRGHAEKLKVLRFKDPPSEWLQLLHGFNRLEDFSVVWFNRPGLPLRPLSLTLPFCVHKLVMVASPAISIRLNWEAITDLCLCQVDYETCVEVFLQCFNLRSCRCVEPKERKGSSPSWKLLERLGGYDHLEHLAWHFPNIEPRAFSLCMFGRLVLPSIRTLHLKIAGVAKLESCDGLASTFIKCLPRTLKSVTLELDTYDLHNPFTWSGVVQEWLVGCSAGLEYFCVLGASACPQMLTEFCNDIHDGGTEIRISADTVEFLPMAKTRCIYHTWAYCSETSERSGFDPEAVIRMLREHKILGLKEFRLELPVRGPREEIQELEGLIREGLKGIYGILFKVRIGDEYFEVGNK